MSPAGAAQTQFLLARAWHQKGRIAAAIVGYREVLAVDPHHPDAARLLGALLEGQLRLEEALAVYRHALEFRSDDAILHKRFGHLLSQREGVDAVFRHYRLDRLDARDVNTSPTDLLCCLVERNEHPRLPYFLEYYRARGVCAFFAVDNASTDGSADFLLRQPDVFLWRSELEFHRANFGAGWFEPILRRYGLDRWCLIVDADELLYYPDCERRTIADLCRTLDRKGKRAYRAVHLDMYSDRPIRDTHYTPGQRFEDLCPYFDGRFYHRCEPSSGPFRNQPVYWGGARERVFNGDGYYLSKVPLLRYEEHCILAGGQHWTNLPAGQIADETGVLLHFKYFASFCDYARQEARREVHSGAAALYQRYARVLDDRPDLALYDPSVSLRLEDSGQLTRLGIMHPDHQADPASAIEFPAVEPAISEGPRPFWSVMVTVYNRAEYLPYALRSVLAEAPGPLEMQIEVVIEGGDPSFQDRIEEMIHSIAGDRATAYRHDVRAGHPEIFNICLRRARGLWVHILHDDDLVAPGFYRALGEGIAKAPAIGAAFCRCTNIDGEGRTLGLSLLERETPGEIEGWLDRIAVCCRLQTPSIVVRREAYEKLGGYCPQAGSAFDWEMWQRLAAQYPVWYDPTPLAFFRRTATSEGSRLALSGQQIAHTRAAIEIARTYLPGPRAAILSRQASEYYAAWAFDLARKQLEKGNLASAFENLAQGVRCSRSPEAARKLCAALLPADGPGT